MPLKVLLPATVVICAGMSAFFDPALRGSLGSLVPSRELLAPTNALMESTGRFARVLGPGVIALAGAFIPTVHLFTADAATFVVSAVAIGAISATRFTHSADAHGAEPSRATPWAVWQAVRSVPQIRFAVLSGGWVSAAWTFVLPLGIGLFMRERAPHDVSALGAVLTAYGVGNVTSNVLIPNLAARPERLMFGGRVVAGLGFLAFAFAPSGPWLWLSAALAASGGPATDVGFLGMLQARFPPREQRRVYRLNAATQWGMILVMFFASPTLLRWMRIAPLVALCGAVILTAGVIGLARFGLRGEAIVSEPAP